jgi:hypothetical protein
VDEEKERRKWKEEEKTIGYHSIGEATQNVAYDFKQRHVENNNQSKKIERGKISF